MWNEAHGAESMKREGNKVFGFKLRLTILPDANINAVVFGSLILIITAAKRCKGTPQLICNLTGNLEQENYL